MRAYIDAHRHVCCVAPDIQREFFARYLPEGRASQRTTNERNGIFTQRSSCRIPGVILLRGGGRGRCTVLPFILGCVSYIEDARLLRA